MGRHRPLGVSRDCSNPTVIYPLSDQGQELDSCLKKQLSWWRHAMCLSSPSRCFPSFPEPTIPVELLCTHPSCTYAFISSSITSQNCVCACVSVHLQAGCFYNLLLIIKNFTSKLYIYFKFTCIYLKCILIFKFTLKFIVFLFLKMYFNI